MRKLFKENKVFRRRFLLCSGIAACVIVRVGIGLASSEADKIKGMGSEGCVQVATYLDATETDSSAGDVVTITSENGTTEVVINTTTETVKPEATTEGSTSGSKPNSTEASSNNGSTENGNEGSTTTEAPTGKPDGGEKPQATTEQPSKPENTTTEDTKPQTPTTEATTEDTKPETPTTTEEPKPEKPSTTESPTTEEHKECQHNWIGVRETIHHDAVYETRTVCVQEAYDEPIYDWHSFCNGCGMDLTINFPNKDYSTHTDFCQGSSTYHTDKVLVNTIHHDAVYETKEVCVQQAWDEIVTHTVCSICGYQIN